MERSLRKSAMSTRLPATIVDHERIDDSEKAVRVFVGRVESIVNFIQAIRRLAEGFQSRAVHQPTVERSPNWNMMLFNVTNYVTSNFPITFAPTLLANKNLFLAGGNSVVSVVKFSRGRTRAFHGRNVSLMSRESP